MGFLHLLLFGDQVVEKLSAVRNLYAISKTRPQLQRFLREATDVVQCHLSALTPAERSGFGHFADLLELAESYAAQEHPDEIAGATLITTTQIGEFLALAEDNISVLETGTNNVYQLGFCVGLLAASVAAAARDTSEVVTLGVETVAISFRLGLELSRRARSIEDINKSWGCTLVGIAPEDIQQRLDELNKVLPLPRHAYVGVITSAWATVFAPPSTLELLHESKDLQDIPKSPLTAAIAVHAPHLYPIDSHSVVGDSANLDVDLPSKTSISSSTCAPYDASTLRELLNLAIDDVAHKPLWLENTVKTLGFTFKGKSEVTLTTLGPTPHTPMVKQMLQQNIEKVHLGEGAKSRSACSNARGGSDLIAIVGMSGRFPQSNSLDGFWDMLQAGTATHQEIPASRFPLNDFYDPSEKIKNPVLTRFGCFLKNPGDFDNRFFNISPREALQMDPLQRMLLMTTYEALEMAGYAHDATNSTHNSRVAAFFGQTTEDWRTINDQQGTDTHYLPCSNRAFAPGRLNHHFKWGGGYYSIDTACSSSSTSIYLACNALIARESDMTVVGGGSLCLIPELYSGLSRGGFLSSTGGCKSFADDADGYCHGEAVGVVVLKRLEDALRENDNVLAVVRGAARNSNGGVGSLTHPGAAAQEALYHKLLRQASVDPHDVGFIEMHGTGTQAGDTVEMNTVRNVFAQSRSRDNPLHVGALKANIGHSEAAAGVVSLIKTVLMLRRHQIPPQPGYPFMLNSKFPRLDDANIKIADGRSQLIPRSKGDGKRKLMINGFDAAGGSTSILIEDPPPQSSKQRDPRIHHVILCSARTSTSLAANKSRLQEYLMKAPGIDLADLAYTTTARRLHEVCRDAYVVDSVEELVRRLNTSDGEKQPHSKSTGSPLLFVFTGQSSQYTAMGATLYESSPRFRRTLDSYEALCIHQGLAPFIEIIRGTRDVASSTTAQLQLAIVALEIGLARYWQSLGLQPTLVMGHSLGEYAALCIAGVLSVSDTLYLVHERATLMQDRCTAGSYAMLAIPLSANSIQNLLRGRSHPSCEISCFNGPSMTVVSGVSEELMSLQAELKSMEINAIQLQVQYGFHSRQMEPILDDFESAAKRVHFGEPIVPVASTLTGKIVRSRDVFNAQYLSQQMRRPVDFLNAVRTCETEGLIQSDSTIFEIGPHPVCLGLVASCLAEAKPTSFGSLQRGQNDWKAISTCLSGAYRARLPVDWQEFHKDYLDCMKLLDLPTYSFDLKNYWIPYRRQDTENEALLPSKTISDFSTTCLQRVESLHVDDGKLFATFASNASESNLFRAIQGHIVDGVPIYPAGVFADMAYTATRFLLHQTGTTADSSALELVDLDMTQALVVTQKDPEQIIRVNAAVDEVKASVSIRFSSSTAYSSAKHGTCRVLVGNEGSYWKSEWSRMQRLVKGRVDSLIASSTTGLAHRMTRALIYKLFASLVDYDRPYQALHEVHIDECFEDATASMTLGQAAGLGSFTYSPYAIDALVHLAGFILNGDLAKPNDDIHIANHIGSMRILGELSEVRQLTCYAAIRERTSKGLTLCDVYVFEGANLVALCTDIRFQKLTRTIFKALTGKGEPAVSRISSEAETSRHVLRRPVKEIDSASSDNGRTPSPSRSRASPASSQTSIDTLDPSAALLEVVAARTGLCVEEMHPTTAFADMGVDSPMSIAILTDFKKREGTELPVAFFTSFPTVADVRDELGSTLAPTQPRATTTVQAPAKVQAFKPKDLDSQAQPGRRRNATEPSERLLRIVATELGIDQDELASSIDFASAGVDSILSIKILSTFKKETGVELPAAFFNSNATVAEVREELDEHTSASEQDGNLTTPLSMRGRMAEVVRSKHSLAKASGDPPPATTIKTALAGARKEPPAPAQPAPRLSGHKKHVAPVPPPQPQRSETESRAILIQGKARSTEAPLFLATDGSGSVAAYIHLPPLPRGRRIYALESPFLEVPEDYTLMVQEMAEVFIKAIRKIQPHGPYLIGGWSAGSIYAYEISYRLTLAGEKIIGLIIMDMRVPHSVPDAEVVTMAFVEKTGAFTGVNRASNFLHGLSEKQKMHLTSTVRALIKYDPIPFSNEDRPFQTHLVWATEGLNESSDPNERDERITGPAAMGPAGSDKALSTMSMEEFEIELKSWFFAKRYHFGTNGWEDFVGDNIVVHKIEADHFSMVAPPRVKNLGTIILDAIDSFTEFEG